MWEAYERMGSGDRISETSARLLATAILSNTADFRMALTCDRDRRAYTETLARSGLAEDFRERYFAEVDAETLSDVVAAIAGDTKDLTNGVRFAQVELWDARALWGRSDLMEVVSRGMNIVSEPLKNDEIRVRNEYHSETYCGGTGSEERSFKREGRIFQGLPWLLLIPCISEGVSYIVCTDNELQRILSACVGATWQESIGVTPTLLLRKEVLGATGYFREIG